ncbi:CBS domain-containing protein CBSCBSPB1 [Raphanus sativus]|nr:CBS domain-containing protein CBSCBSPB1 [Raphanus sativus]
MDLVSKTADTRSLTEVITAILQRVGSDIDSDKYLKFYSDLQAAIDHAKSIGWKSLKLYLDDSKGGKGRGRRRRATVSGEAMEYVQTDAWAACVQWSCGWCSISSCPGFMAYLKESRTVVTSGRTIKSSYRSITNKK